MSIQLWPLLKDTIILGDSPKIFGVKILLFMETYERPR